MVNDDLNYTNLNKSLTVNRNKSGARFEHQDGVQSIHRAVLILRAVSKYSDKGARLSTIARKVDLHVATTRRILLVLCAEGFITYDSVLKLYYISPAIYSLCTIPQYSIIRNRYRFAIERITKETGDTVYLTIRSGDDTLGLDRAEGHCAIRIIYDIGMRLPLGLGASGLAILSCLPDKEVERILSTHELRYAQHNNMTVEKVRKLLKRARKLGYSLNEGNYQKGVTGVGVCLFDEQDEPIGAITVASISDRMDRSRCDEIAQLVKSEIALTKV